MHLPDRIRLECTARLDPESGRMDDPYNTTRVVDAATGEPVKDVVEVRLTLSREDPFSAVIVVRDTAQRGYRFGTAVPTVTRHYRRADLALDLVWPATD